MKYIFLMILVLLSIVGCTKDENSVDDKNTSSTETPSGESGNQNHTSNKPLTPQQQFELSEKERIQKETKAFDAYQKEISAKNKTEFEQKEKERIQKETEIFNLEQKKISEKNKQLFGQQNK